MAKTTPKIPPCQAEGSAKPPPFLPTGADGGSEATLLYLSCNNSDEVPSRFNRLSPYHKKQAATIRQNAERFLVDFGVENVGFLTLTFPDNVTDHKEASRRFDNLRRRFLSVYFPNWMLVKERQKRGAWHYHLLVDCQKDIRTGFDFWAYRFIGNLRTSAGAWAVVKDKIKPYQRKMARSACPALRSLWSELPEKVKAYGFGRVELMPIETTVEAVSKYVGKYISKHVDSRTEQDKGVRLFDSSRGFVRSSTKFQWNGEGSKEWRKNVEKFAALVGVDDLEGMSEKFGSRWAYTLQHHVFAVDTLAPSEIVRLRSHHQAEPSFVSAADGKSSTIMEALIAFQTARNPPPVFRSGCLVSPQTGEVYF